MGRMTVGIWQRGDDSLVTIKSWDIDASRWQPEKVVLDALPNTVLASDHVFCADSSICLSGVQTLRYVDKA